MSLFILLITALSTMFTDPVRAEGDEALETSSVETVAAAPKADLAIGADLFNGDTNTVETPEGDINEAKPPQGDAVLESTFEQKVPQGDVEKESSDQENETSGFDTTFADGSADGQITSEDSFPVEDASFDASVTDAASSEVSSPEETSFDTPSMDVASDTVSVDTIPATISTKSADPVSFYMPVATAVEEDDDDDDEEEEATPSKKELVTDGAFDQFEDEIKQYQDKMASMDPEQLKKLTEKFDLNKVNELLNGMLEKGELLEDENAELSLDKENLTKIAGKMSEAFGDFGGFVAKETEKSKDKRDISVDTEGEKGSAKAKGSKKISPEGLGG